MGINAAEINNVAVIGAGLMGHGIAQSFALAGFSVRLHDVSSDRVQRGLEGLAANLETFVANDLVGASAAEEALRRVTGTINLAEAAASADFVVEAVYEDIAVKQTVFRQLTEFCPSHAVMASNTSGLSVERMAEASTSPERVIVTHFWNPPHIMGLVEVVPGSRTSEETKSVACDVLRRCGKYPVLLSREVPGHIGNRLQFALLREALSLVQRGIASAEDVDAVVELTFGRRLPATGPLKTVDLGGLDSFLRIANYLFDDLESTSAPVQLLADAASRGDLGAKTGRGLFDWSGERAEQARARRDAELIRWLKMRGV